MKILSFFAHPDDETVFLGGTFAYLAAQGAEIHFASATRGEGGEMGDPPICTREELGAVRENEITCAVEKLSGTSLQFMDFRDPPVGPDGELYPYAEDDNELVKSLRELITSINPQIIISHGPGGEYGHPAHIQSHQGLMKALEKEPDLHPVVYSPSWLNRETGEFSPSPDFMVDITTWFDIKIEAIQCYRSQHDMFLRHGSARAGRPVTIPEMIRVKETLSRIQPEVQGAPDDPLAELLAEISIPIQPSFY